jgi:hypothetical protein
MKVLEEVLLLLATCAAVEETGLDREHLRLLLRQRDSRGDFSAHEHDSVRAREVGVVREDEERLCVCLVQLVLGQGREEQRRWRHGVSCSSGC